MISKSAFKPFVLLMVASLALAACSGNRGTKETVGGIGGAVIGGLLGSQFGGGSGRVAAAAAGAVIGGFLGSELGASLDEQDRQRSDRAYERAQTAPVGQTISWNNPDSGNHGTVTPVRDGTSTDGEYCREFQQTVTIGGEQEEAYGVACRQPDGSWEIQ
ncbi:RT0821/Lpp0805 family surface protein [Kiloniella sp. b19]|uniref:RT0821/Lpp0805 family surface protein n=1 Tax=Kiloniella sp. GXU_MW_B19 TaxID=3141326 RepID=UPI0031E1AB16